MTFIELYIRKIIRKSFFLTDVFLKLASYIFCDNQFELFIFFFFCYENNTNGLGVVWEGSAKRVVRFEKAYHGGSKFEQYKIIGPHHALLIISRLRLFCSVSRLSVCHTYSCQKPSLLEMNLYLLPSLLQSLSASWSIACHQSFNGRFRDDFIFAKAINIASSSKTRTLMPDLGEHAADLRPLPRHLLVLW